MNKGNKVLQFPSNQSPTLFLRPIPEVNILFKLPHIRNPPIQSLLTLLLPIFRNRQDVLRFNLRRLGPGIRSLFLGTCIFLEELQDPSELLAHASPTRLPYSDEIVQQDRHEDVEDDIREHDAIVPPSRGIRDLRPG